MPPQRGQGQWALGHREPLNQNERVKRDDDGLNARQRVIDRYQYTGFDSIDPADLRGRFRWLGLYTQRAPSLEPSLFVGAATTSPLSPEVLAAYDAPFPEPRLTAGLRQLTALLPLTRNDVGARLGRRTMRALEQFERPFLTCYSDGDPATRGWETVFAERVPGARDQQHRTITGAGHFLQEDAGEELGRAIVEFVAAG